MKGSDKRFVDRFNLVQRNYFERSVKTTMIPTNSPYQRRHVDELLNFAQVSPGDSMLEVGCGMGRYTLILAERGIEVTGIDISPVLLKRLNYYAGESPFLRLLAGDILNPPFKLEGHFDVVAGFFTLHHLHNMRSCFESMIELAAAGGRIIFLEPNAFNPLYYLQITFTAGMTWEGDKGVLKMRKRHVSQMMREAGLQKVIVRRFGFFPPFLANHPLGSKLERMFERVSLWRPFLPFQLFIGTRP